MHRIVIACDPNARGMKIQLTAYLQRKGYPVTDYGSDDPIYANTAFRLADAIARREFDRGILLCGTGIGVSIAANKVKGAYAALITDAYSAERARKSNKANIACFGAFTLGIRNVEKLADIYLSSEFEDGCSSQPKIDRIREYETRQ
ncbi:RpiB/LacA/LacB family sugar-phosphate isomerase [Diplocloster hominis]|uniref:RpiB/LacA/LacB family sugar-phosphate isomerase n=1 Tax=Diplocloster hominis TaxID=3079010 RepID=UPI0031BA8FD4